MFKIEIYIQGHREKIDANGNYIPNRISKEFFKKDFQLLLADTSYKIRSFRLVWDHSNSITDCAFKGNWVSIDLNEFTESLRDLNAGDFITIEDIYVKKNGECFKLRPLIVYVRE